MSRVDATGEQRAKAMEISGAAAADLETLATQHRDAHKALLALLREPTVDRAKLETLRSETLRGVDEASKRMTAAMGDLAEVLTPAQREKLADTIERQVEKRQRF